MEEELVQLFQAARKAADAAAVNVSGGEADESRCLDALKRLKSFPVNSQVLVSTQVGRGIRRLTKHPKKKIQAFASDLVQIWKQIVAEESNGCKRKETETGSSPGKVRNGDSNEVERDSPVMAEEASVTAISKARKIVEDGTPGSNKVEKTAVEEKSDRAINKLRPNPGFEKPIPLVKCNDPMRDRARGLLHEPLVERDSPVMAEEASVTAISKARKIVEDGTPGSNKVEKTAVEEKSDRAINKLRTNPGFEKSIPLVKCNDPMRDRARELLHEALSKVSGEAEEDMIEEVNACDPARVTVSVESVMFEKWGRMNGAHKARYRSIMFNIKDQNNPDFRRKVLLGQIEPERLLTMTTQEMASDHRQRENQLIQEKAMNECELGAAPRATTDQFKCSRCGHRKCTYYQMQTRSADEPMTTYVTCVNCNNHWKFC